MKNEPIRIAQIMGKWVGGGVEAVIMNYYRHIDRSKIQFDFICDEDSTDIPYEEIKKLGGRVIICPPYQKLPKYLRELKKIFKENNYKIVHSNINTLSVFPLYAAKKAGIPVRIAHSHSTILNNKKEWKRNILKNVLKKFSKKYANVYLCCSNKAGKTQFGESFYNKGKVKIIKNAIDTDLFSFNNWIRNKKRKELGIERKAIVIGHVGRFVTTKNHSFLLDIFYEIQKKYPNAVLVLTGQGPLMNKILEKTLKLGIEEKVFFLGQRNDVAEIYQTFDAFVLPSLYEGFPVVAVEAQTMGIPCYLSNNMDLDVKILETTTFLDINESPTEWATRIIDGLKHDNLKKSKRIVVEKGFDIKTESKKLEKFYEGLLGN